ncbi:MAG TPA: alpha/beta hydrolase [Streptosporangiaceae bacterium]|nr:alpha/beta hydrolase [Streptosporangiaceae bacterium]
MATASVNGITISYHDSGGTGPVIVFSHGFLMDSSMFDPQVAALTPGYRVITWDERGFGATPATAPFSYWDSAADLLALLDHLGIDEAVLGGMSQGGFISLRAALKAPERVRGLVLIDSQAGLENPDVVPAYEQMEQIWREQGPEPVQDVVAALILGPPGGPVDYGPWFAKWATTDRDGFRHAFRCLVDRDDITGRLGEISIPALIIHGTADASVPMERAEVVRDGLAGVTTFVQIEGGSHAANLSNPDEVNAAIGDFLRSLDG